jgi:integrase
MPKLAEVLGPLAVKNLSRKPGRHTVGGVAGLKLEVKDTLAAYWNLRYQVAGVRRQYGIGAYPGVSLADARIKAQAARDEIREGIDPIDKRRAARSALVTARANAKTFKQVAEQFIKVKSPGWTNKKHTAQWDSTLRAFAYPFIGEMLVRDVAEGDILRVIDPIWNEKHETAIKVRQRIEAILDYATARKFRSGANPARFKSNLEFTLTSIKRSQRIEHFPALPHRDVGAFMAALRKVEGMGARALEFTILSAMRSGEVRGAQWTEIDLKARIWTVPKERLGKDKSRKEPHLVPLTDAMLAILEALPHREGFVFHGRVGASDSMSDATLAVVIDRMNKNPETKMRWVDPMQNNRPAVPHGFRSTFKDWSRAMNMDREATEEAMTHVIENKVEGSYARNAILARRVPLMDAWSKYCAKVQPPQDGSNVVDIAQARAASNG